MTRKCALPKQKLGAAAAERDPAIRATRAAAQRRRRQNPEVRAAEAEAKRRRRNDPEVRAAEAEAYRRRCQEDPAVRAAKAEAQRRRRQNPEVRATEAEAKHRRRDLGVRAAEAEAYRRRCQKDPAVRSAKAEAQRRRRQNPEVCAAEAEAKRRRREDPAVHTAKAEAICKARLAKSEAATNISDNPFGSVCSVWDRLQNDLKPLPDRCHETLQREFPNLDLCQFRLCSTCMRPVGKGDIPSYSHNQRFQISPEALAPPTSQCEASPEGSGRQNCSEQRQSAGQWVGAVDRSCQRTKVTQCKSCVDQVCTLGSQTETGHVMAETSTQTAMAFPRTIPVQTSPTELRSQGTNTGMMS
ncbi:uncharacterized protein LOC119461596 isoform X2 [Dermacentor silvarum]|uniref:uncharacterized protein LOC119461596 isoform X2 n=1 Tax=Dermacentor silvarum TaxID=543639 RepID=UPI00189741BD|nr:uncharacterized protein LOC119461596 isoform X2 [Dermacentor silvarum]